MPSRCSWLAMVVIAPGASLGEIRRIEYICLGQGGETGGGRKGRGTRGGDPSRGGRCSVSGEKKTRLLAGDQNVGSAPPPTHRTFIESLHQTAVDEKQSCWLAPSRMLGQASPPPKFGVPLVGKAPISTAAASPTSTASCEGLRVTVDPPWTFPTIDTTSD